MLGKTHLPRIDVWQAVRSFNEARAAMLGKTANRPHEETRLECLQRSPSSNAREDGPFASYATRRRQSFNEARAAMLGKTWLRWYPWMGEAQPSTKPEQQCSGRQQHLAHLRLRIRPFNEARAAMLGKTSVSGGVYRFLDYLQRSPSSNAREDPPHRKLLEVRVFSQILRAVDTLANKNRLPRNDS